MICETSQGSSCPLSVTTRMPWWPASSRARANSRKSRAQTSGSAREESGQVEKIFRSCSRTDMQTLVRSRRKRSSYVAKVAHHDREGADFLVRSVHDRRRLGG